ncbi:carboxypeptidase regulatory-like domain-containing protein [Pseudomonas sp. ML96]|uniref:carboxypeptidase regulatory-like domain-containing protein n=1 Tax=Pseudomonas sp. ML96 TaxID=1523503 RepID=UPI00068D8E45|nr:carboxypeptidase regulatory-like domain-containing protein [Pseudomonas sp. ML96]
MPRALFSALLALGLSACVPYPAYRTTQPEAELQVLDEQGQALVGANVTLIARAHPTPFEQSRETRSTDAEGIARFASQHEWQAEVMFLHGRLVYYWEWCVTAAGYQTALIPFSTPLQIRLQRGASEPCPAPRD